MDNSTLPDDAFGENASGYAQEFYRVIRHHSIYKDNPIPEWKVTGVYKGNGRCICTKTITNLYQIQNKLTEKVLEIGSDCVERWNIAVNLQCVRCDASLGKSTSSKLQRLLKKELHCPMCRSMLLKRSTNRLYVSGPWYETSFRDVVAEEDWVSLLVDLVPKREFHRKSLAQFLDYAQLFYTFDPTPGILKDFATTTLFRYEA